MEFTSFTIIRYKDLYRKGSLAAAAAEKPNSTSFKVLVTRGIIKVGMGQCGGRNRN